jgi:CheY-like chemotaxis protein
MQRQRFDRTTPMTPEEVQGPASLFRLVETMMALNPQYRYQTASQLLDAIRAVRADLEGRGAARMASGPKAVFVVEKDDRLQEAIREKFKELGYRVFMAVDPVRAMDRFRQQPFDALVVDVGTTGEDGLLVFDNILTSAQRQNVRCAGILILNDEQASWADRVKQGPTTVVMTRIKGRGVTLKQLYTKLQELVPIEQ